MPSAARRLAWRYRRARRELPNVVRRAVVSARRERLAEAAPAAPAPTPPEPAGADREALLRALARGATLEHAVVTQTRALLSGGQADAAQSLAESLRRRPDTEALGHLTGGMAAFHRGFHELAWDHLHRLPLDTWARHAAPQFARSGLAVAPEEALAEIRRLVAEDPPQVRTRRWFDVLTAVFGYGEEELAREVFAIFDRHVREDGRGWKRAEVHRDWLRPWIAASADSPTAPSVPGRPAFAVMDYGHPAANRASANIGDHIQTIAALGHLVRHQNVRLHGREDLVDLLAQLRGRTRPELQRTDVDGDLEVLTVHRDASMYEAVPEGTWVLCFGWFMHALFRMRHGFPLHDNLRPIFISFHCNKRDLLTPEAVEYLKRYGPVGCRDWTTVYLLLSLGVPAFFSGCLTTTINTVFPDLTASAPGDAPIAYVDAPPADVPEGAVTYRHSDGAVRRRSFVANVYEGIELLETYRRQHRGIVTSRLHCYLPARSIGMDVDFRPSNRSDVRFEGLIDISDGEFDAIRDGIVDKLGQVFTAMLSGRPEEEVYGLWREITAADVAAAEERRGQEIRLEPVAADIGGQVERAVAETTVHDRGADGEPVHVAVILGRGGGLSLTALVSSLLEHASRPVHLSVLAMAGTGVQQRRLAQRFPELSFSWIPVRGLGADLRTPQGTEPRQRGLVRLLLPDLLPEVERAVLLPLPSIATADIAELADLDLGSYALAAPRRAGTAISGFGVIHGAALRLGHRNQAASALRRTAHARHAFDFDAFSADVMVLDLARLRADGFTGQALPLVETFGLNDVEALHYLVGPERATVPPAWARVPTRMPPQDPGLLHWADRVKPWQPELTPERERWREHADRFRRGGRRRPVPSRER